MNAMGVGNYNLQQNVGPSKRSPLSWNRYELDHLQDTKWTANQTRVAVGPRGGEDDHELARAQGAEGDLHPSPEASGPGRARMDPVFAFNLLLCSAVVEQG